MDSYSPECSHHGRIAEMKELLVNLAANEIKLKNQNDRLFSMMKNNDETQD